MSGYSFISTKTGLTGLRVRVRIGPSLFIDADLSETGHPNEYHVDDSVLVAQGMSNIDGEYPVLILDADDNVIGGGELSWTGTVCRPPRATIDMPQLLTAVLPLGGTVGDALQAALAQGTGKWSVDRSANTITLYAPDKTTPVVIFDVSPKVSAALRRTPR